MPTLRFSPSPTSSRLLTLAPPRPRRHPRPPSTLPLSTIPPEPAKESPPSSLHLPLAPTGRTPAPKPKKMNPKQVFWARQYRGPRRLPRHLQHPQPSQHHPLGLPSKEKATRHRHHRRPRRRPSTTSPWTAKDTKSASGLADRMYIAGFVLKSRLAKRTRLPSIRARPPPTRSKWNRLQDFQRAHPPSSRSRIAEWEPRPPPHRRPWAFPPAANSLLLASTRYDNAGKPYSSPTPITTANPCKPDFQDRNVYPAIPHRLKDRRLQTPLRLPLPLCPPTTKNHRRPRRPLPIPPAKPARRQIRTPPLQHRRPPGFGLWIRPHGRHHLDRPPQ